jgi:hypothetical protein
MSESEELIRIEIKEVTEEIEELLLEMIKMQDARIKIKVGSNGRNGKPRIKVHF